ncbi:MAG: hypothetical protein ACXVIJ_15390 [Thermoanaerobaculia bacterium]
MSEHGSSGAVGSTPAGRATDPSATDPSTGVVGGDLRTALHDPVNGLVALLDSMGDVGMTPEGLIAMAQHRLQAIDSQMQGVMAEMNVTGTKLAMLRAATGAVNEWRTAHHGSSDKMDLDTTIVDVQNPDGTHGSMTAAQALREAGMDLSSLHTEGDPPHIKIDDAGLANFADAIRAQIDTVNEGADINQLRLQQLVSSRGQITQTVSQVIAAQHENAKAILQNIRA